MKTIEIESRVMEVADYVLETGCTVRQCANHFKTSKSTIHTDLSKRLPQLNLTQYKEVKKILDTNWDERQLRGGLATKAKYERMQ